MTRRLRPYAFAATGCAALGVAVLGAGTAAAAPGDLDSSMVIGQSVLDSAKFGSVAASDMAGMGSLGDALGIRCTALDPFSASLGGGMQLPVDVVPAGTPGDTAFLVQPNMPSEGTSTTDDLTIHWENTDTGASGVITQDQLEQFMFDGEYRYGLIVHTGAGRVEWTLDAVEDGWFPPATSLGLAGIPPNASFPYTDCRGGTQVP